MRPTNSWSRSGARPKIFLATLGKAADFTPRATFAKNFFEAGGIEAVSSEDDDATLDRAFKASGAALACLCGADKTYESEAAAAAAALKAAGARHIYLAGRPGEARSAIPGRRRADLYLRRLRRARRAHGNPWSHCQIAANPSDCGPRKLSDRRAMSRPDQPLGWRKRIGVLSPTVMETACHDFYKMAPMAYRFAPSHPTWSTGTKRTSSRR